MAQTSESFVSIHPYFRVSEARAGAFRNLCECFVEKTRSEPKCVFYGFSFHGDEVYCREGYRDAEGLLAHLDNVGSFLKKPSRSPKLRASKFTAPKRSSNVCADRYRR